MREVDRIANAARNDGRIACHPDLERFKVAAAHRECHGCRHQSLTAADSQSLLEAGCCRRSQAMSVSKAPHIAIAKPSSAVTLMDASTASRQLIASSRVA